MVLEQYSVPLGRIAGSFGVLFVLVPGTICVQVIRQGSTENVSPLHFIIAGSLTLIKLRHGQILNSAAMVASTTTSLALFSLYFSIYMYYCDRRRAVLKILMKFLIIPFVMISYSLLDEPVRAEKYFGIGCSVLIFCIMFIPLYKIKAVVKQKHTGDLSLPMALFSSINCILWFLYALSLGKYIEIFSRFFTCLLVVPQAVLFLIYPMPKPKSHKL